MSFRSLAFGLIAGAAVLALAACQGASAQPPAATTAATAAPVAKATVLPSPSKVPTATGRPEEPTAKVDLPSSAIVTQHTPTPTPPPTTTVNSGEPKPQESQPARSQNQAQRGSEQETTYVVAAPQPTQEPIEAQQSTEDHADPKEAFKTELSNSDDLHTDTGMTSSRVLWSFNGTTWSPSGTPPDCAEPLVLQTPVDMNIVTAALWPGQVRGGYKSHGGFRFDATNADDITVRAPIGSHLVQAARYLEGDDEQYLLFFSVPCGFFYRFDHVRTLPARLEDALKEIPSATSGDSRTTYINPPLWLEQGEVVGTSVGIAPSNIFIDFGLYDVRTPNDVIPNPTWVDRFATDIEFGHFGVCFFDYLPGIDGAIMRSLPTGKEGKTSDYCD